ncbi:hypothetical protein RKS58_07805 [Lysinibacillus capsici]|uniref:hypothetical protein n=1 Tax=Lysinibacillus capsici TaxID=2115968 RepID=UPI0028BF3D5D|nr:hypothetical protein [Lysinibacillus capsici]WNN77734.1 hypothetical protein RKS58_07805 [Lysinibacillus capsici]
MKIPNDNCLKAVMNFSMHSTVTIPINIDEWWQHTVHQLKDWEIHLFYIALKSAISDGLLDGELTSMMLSELEKVLLKKDVNFSMILSDTL